ncbi:hypothetical protein VNI00_017877 [Paramarasmius palmivorus]|uniref:Uncharacterized protein n=1 Tax=Paramarasmius palmivorus TaxID=297713 RepID=A0AAW0B2D2_9AGAR
MKWLALLCIVAVSSWGLNVTIDNVDPTSAELENGAIRLHITWRADGDGFFKFALKKPGVDDFPSASTSDQIDAKSTAFDFKFESVSPGNYSLVAWNDDGSNNGVDLGRFSAPIEAKNPNNSILSSVTSGDTQQTLGPGSASQAFSVTMSPSRTEDTTSTPSSTDTWSAMPMDGEDEDCSNGRNGRTRSIVGGVIGGITLILLVIALLLCIRRRSSKRISIAKFCRERMVKQRVSRRAQIPTRQFSYTTLTPQQDDRSCSSSPLPSVTESETTAVEPYDLIDAEKAVQTSRTDRQMEIEERMQELQAQLITLHYQSKLEGSSSEEGEARIKEIREKVNKLNALKNGDWAKELSDERPLEML